MQQRLLCRLGPDHFVRHDKAKAAMRLVRQRTDLMFE